MILHLGKVDHPGLVRSKLPGHPFLSVNISDIHTCQGANSQAKLRFRASRARSRVGVAQE
jgi:hypothetical protein